MEETADFGFLDEFLCLFLLVADAAGFSGVCGGRFVDEHDDEDDAVADDEDEDDL